MHGESLLINCPADVLIRRDPKRENRTHISQDDQSEAVILNRTNISNDADQSEVSIQVM